jgi:hypothetical protein
MYNTQTQNKLVLGLAESIRLKSSPVLPQNMLLKWFCTGFKSHDYSTVHIIFLYSCHMKCPLGKDKEYIFLVLSSTL